MEARNIRFTTVTFATCTIILASQLAWAAGGCGSVCLPLEVLDPEKTQLHRNTLRIGTNYERARFNNFREGNDDIPNPGGNKAVITQASFFADYGVSEKFTASLLVPYVKKDQETNRFNNRVAEGVGDISVFGRYEIVSPQVTLKPTAYLKGPMIALGLGLKFPTGSINEPDKNARLPPAFQTGSGAYDIVPTASYFQDFGNYSLFGSTFSRIPLEENHRGYKFGKEYELNIGGQYPLPVYRDLSLMLSFSLLHAEHDRDSEGMLSAQLRIAMPIYEDWNGRRQTNVGQVAPDVTTMFTLTYNIGRYQPVKQNQIIRYPVGKSAPPCLPDTRKQLDTSPDCWRIENGDPKAAVLDTA